jgi:hypothetical protein
MEDNYQEDMDIPEPPQQPQQAQQHTGIFRGKPQQQPDLRSFTEDIGNLSRRLRLLEENFTNQRKALQVTEQNMLGKNKVFATEIRTINSDISDIKQELAELREKMLEMVRELNEAAKREEVKVLEKYINFWDPVKFVTQNEVEGLVKEIMKRNTADKGKDIKNK